MWYRKGPDYTCTPVIVKVSLGSKKRGREISEHLSACQLQEKGYCSTGSPTWPVYTNYNTEM